MNSQCIPLHDVTHPQSARNQLHIASVVAYVRPEQLHEICDWLLQPHEQISAEIHAQNDQGKLVIVTESAAEKSIANFLDELRNQTGVLNVALVYHEYLSAQDLQDEEANVEQNS